MPNMKKSDPMLAKQVKKDVKFLKEKAVAKKTTTKAPAKTTTKAPAKTKMTPQDAAMKKILEKRYGKIYG